MAESVDSAGVSFPPPIWYALAILGGYFLNRRLPLPIAVGPVTRIAGLVIGAAGIVLAFTAFGLFRRARTTPIPRRPATTLVIVGPYRFTRNPMYVSLALVTVASGLLLATWWPIILLAPTLVIVQTFVIHPEERYLRRRFGPGYDAYARRVRRWL